MATAEKTVPAKDTKAAGNTRQTAVKAPRTVQAQATGKSVKAVKAVKQAAAKESKDEKSRRPKKDKVVRDSFTMPKSDYEKIAELKQRCLDAGVSVKKSELLRAGLALLAAVPPKRLIAAVSALDTVKTGRPAKS